MQKCIRSVRLEFGLGAVPGADRNGADPGCATALNVPSRVSDHRHEGRLKLDPGMIVSTSDRQRGERIAVGVVATEGTKAKVVVQLDDLQLAIRHLLDVAGDQSHVHIGPTTEVIQKSANTGKNGDVFSLHERVSDADVQVQGFPDEVARDLHTIQLEYLRHNLQVGLARKPDVFGLEGPSDKIRQCFFDGPPRRAVCSNQRTVDVKQN